MSSIIGEICSSEKGLKRTAYRRKKGNIEKSVQHGQVETCERNSWRVVRRSKTKTRLRKPKTPDVLFEDRVWMIFYNLGFSWMNKDRNFKLKFNGYTKQIDILAKDENNIFVVECKSSESDESINARSALEEFVGKQEDIQKTLQSEWGHRCGRINFVVVISSEDKRKLDEEYVREKRKEGKNIFLWSAREIKYIESLIQQVGHVAKYQLYSVLFKSREQRSLRKGYPAIKSKIGGRTVYSFMISAKELLKYAYVHHRELTGINEVSQAYQRMLRSTKLKEIRRFIDDEEGFFPNSIIVNFSLKLGWDKKEVTDDVAIGKVTLPKYYGCAWIIDGQHRLYGVASAKRDIVVPVLAFEKMKQKDQANLFVEINEKQKKVPPNLLWDLYSDLYRNSSDEKQKFLYQVTETAKKMGTSGPLREYIDIPSIPVDRPVKLTLTTVCSTIKGYSPWDHLKHPTDETKTPENAARLINSYFEVLKSLWPEDWRKGNKGVLLTNGGFGVFMMVFNDIINYIAYKQKSILGERKTKDFEEKLTELLTPVIEYLKSEKKMQNDIRKQTGRALQSDNTGIFDLKIQEFVKDYFPPRVGRVPTIPKVEDPPAISRIEEKARLVEPRLRDFILERLKRHYGGDNKWWKQGVPGGPKKKADNMWAEEITRKPHLRRYEGKENERKFEFLALGDLKDVIAYGNNWNEIFGTVFMGKKEFERRMKDVSVIRNPSIHIRRMDDQDVVDGIGGLLWLSNCISDRDLNPYS